MQDSEEPLFTRHTLAALVAMSVVFGLLLYWEGRPGWCRYGFGVWSDAWTRCTSQHVLDPYWFSHVLHGVLFFWAMQPFASRIALPWRVVAVLALEIGWELLENSPWVVERYRQQTAALDYTGDSIVNSLGDLAATGVGILFANRFSWKASVALFVILELWMLYVARDNLTLNVLMLLFPLESLKEWQMPG